MRRLHLIPVVVMLLIAIGQAAVASSNSLSPWKGGGFGMFATTDHARVVMVDGRSVTAPEVANQVSEQGLQDLADEYDAAITVYRPEFDALSNQLTWRQIAQWP